MSDEEPSTPAAWQPLTFRGVAAFAHARTSRLLLVQLCVAIAVSMGVLFFLSHAWTPTVTTAIRALPAVGSVRDGKLDWHGDDPVILAESPLLAIIVDTGGSRATGQVADLQLELGADELRFVALLGVLSLPYPEGWEIAVNRTALDPWWGAWNPVLRAVAVLVTIITLLVLWAVMAWLYAPVVWLAVFFTDRVAGWRDCWRMAGAALMPGALLMGGGIVLYAVERISLVHLGFALALHLVLGWIYMIGAPFGLPRALPPPAGAGKNPFVPGAGPAP